MVTAVPMLCTMYLQGMLQRTTVLFVVGSFIGSIWAVSGLSGLWHDPVQAHLFPCLKMFRDRHSERSSCVWGVFYNVIQQFGQRTGSLRKGFVNWKLSNAMGKTFCLNKEPRQVPEINSLFFP